MRFIRLSFLGFRALLMLGALMALVPQQGSAQARGAWSSLFSNNGPNGAVYAIALDRAGQVYVGGSFTEAGGVAANNIARWTGTEWQTLGVGLDGAVYTLAFGLNGELYAGGPFITSGGVLTPVIARWDGTSWEAMVESMSSVGGGGVSVTTLAIDQAGLLYVGGEFSSINGLEAKGIATWDGLEWHELGGGVDGRTCIDSPLDNVWAITIGEDGAVYVAGSFEEAGGLPVHGIAKWTGSVWEAMGTGMNVDNCTSLFSIFDVTVHNDEIYIGGGFTEVDGVPIRTIARWTGSIWESLQGSTDETFLGTVIAMAAGPSGLYVGGGSATVDGQESNSIALWTGDEWQRLGEGLNEAARVQAITVSGNQVYIGGEYLTEAGGQPASGIALWEDADPTSVEESPEIPDQVGIESAFPNPFADATTIMVSSEVQEARLEVYDVLGRRISTVPEGPYVPGRHIVRWSRGDLPGGVYVLRWQAGRVIRTRTLVILP